MTADPTGVETFSVLYFASAAAYTKSQRDVFPAPLPLDCLANKLEERYPGITEKVLDSCAVTINLEYVIFAGDQSTIADEATTRVIEIGDEVAILPPVSSG